MPCVPHRSPIVRLPSGASASPLAVCATAAQLAGAFFATLARLRAALRRGVSLRPRATAFRPAHGIHPPNAARCAWSGYLPSRSRSPRRRLPCTGGGLRSGPARRPASACALMAPAVLARRKRCRLHRLRVQCQPSSHNCADMAHNHCLSSLRLLCAKSALCTTLAHPRRECALLQSGAGEGRGGAFRGRTERRGGISAREAADRQGEREPTGH